MIKKLLSLLFIIPMVFIGSCCNETKQTEEVMYNKGELIWKTPTGSSYRCAVYKINNNGTVLFVVVSNNDTRCGITR